MTIEIQRPELEALIRDRMKSGGFHSVEDVLMQALKSSALAPEQDAGLSNRTPASTGADLVATMQASPFKEINLEPTRDRLPVRDVAF